MTKNNYLHVICQPQLKPQTYYLISLLHSPKYPKEIENIGYLINVKSRIPQELALPDILRSMLHYMLQNK